MPIFLTCSCLGFVNDRTTFIVCSFVIRAIAGAGDAGFYPSAFAIFAYEFPELISTTVVILLNYYVYLPAVSFFLEQTFQAFLIFKGLFEFFFGIGAILGPIACGPLIDVISSIFNQFPQNVSRLKCTYEIKIC